jgi:hypothetical protein
MLKTTLMSPAQCICCVVAVAASITLPATTGHATEESKSENIGPWEIKAIFKGDKFDRCSINRSLQDDIIARFIRTGDGFSLELESPNWKLERGKNYPVKMTIGPLSFDTEFAAESNSVSMDIKDKKLESALRNASALNIVAAGATIRVPLDESTVAFDALEQCVKEKGGTVAVNIFCGPDTFAAADGVREDKSTACQEDAEASEETSKAEDSKPAEDVKPLRRVKSKKFRSRPIPAFFTELFDPPLR